MKLTNKNYFSNKAGKEFCSNSQLKSFIKCEAMTMAELNGEFERETSSAMLLGSLVDCLLTEPEKYKDFQNEHLEMFNHKDVISASEEEMMEKHPEWFTKNNTLKSNISLKKIKEAEPSFVSTVCGDMKAEYKHGLEMVNRCKRDENFMAMLDGNHQVIMTGEIYGVTFKIKMDCYVKDKYICDLKTSGRSLDYSEYDAEDGRRKNVFEIFGYDLQGAIYQEIVRQNTGKILPFYLAVVTSEKHPDIGVFQIDNDSMAEALTNYEDLIRSIPLLKSGKVEPCRCERCDFCKDTKKITSVQDWLFREVD